MREWVFDDAGCLSESKQGLKKQPLPAQERSGRQRVKQIDWARVLDRLADKDELRLKAGIL